MNLEHIDTELFLFLNGLGSPAWDGFWRVVTDKLTSIPLYLLLLCFCWRSLGWKATLFTLVAIALMITVTDQLSYLAKHSFQRPRPCQVDALRDLIRFAAKNCGRYGYFSGHAVSSMALAVFMGLSLRKHYKNLIWLLVAWSLVVGYSRIYLGVHYPADVVTGFVVGALVGWGFYRLTKRLYLKKKSVGHYSSIK